MEEIWKDIEGYEGLYQVSSMGNIRSLNRKRKGPRGNDCICRGKIISKTINHYGYYNSHLHKNGKSEGIIVHRIVAQIFIPNPYNKRTVNHKNGIKTDNRIENLERMTYGENHKHAYDNLGRVGHWKGKIGKNNPSSKIVHQYTKDLKFIKTRYCLSDAERKLGISSGMVAAVCNGRKNSAGGFKRRHFII